MFGKKSPWGGKPSVLIVGSKGRMAQLLCRTLLDHCAHVTGVDCGEPVTDQMLANTDILWISVPMSEIDSVIKKFGPRLRSDALICDINGLKLRVVEEYSKLNCHSLSIHPMFGPFISSLNAQKFLVCSHEPSEQAKWILGEIENRGAKLQVINADSHDYMMALIQVLVHFNKLVLAKTIIERDSEFLKTLEFTSPIYKIELTVLARMFSQSPDLYAQIQTENPFASQIRDMFVSHALELASQLNANDTKGIEDLFQVASPYFQRC